MKLLLTGGAGFIGSHILEAAVADNRIHQIRVLDNLSTGFLKNIEPFLGSEKVEFIQGDILDRDLCKKVVEGMDAVCHQAALGSVPRSIAEPLNTHDNNVTGFLNVLVAAKDAGIKKVVYASSSSVYGDLNEQPKQESRIGKPLSPYAVSKLSNEIYADVFGRCYDMKLYGFRYFNVFGPRQNPDGAYAAVIPLFLKCALSNVSPVINGDGSITRDYTFVGNVVKANINALLCEKQFAGNEVFNIACGYTTTLNVLWENIKKLTNSYAEVHHGPNRKGDILHSLADISKASSWIDYNNLTQLTEGLEQTVTWYVQHVQNTMKA